MEDDKENIDPLAGSKYKNSKNSSYHSDQAFVLQMASKKSSESKSGSRRALVEIQQSDLIGSEVGGKTIMRRKD